MQNFNGDLLSRPTEKDRPSRLDAETFQGKVRRPGYVYPILDDRTS
jgi:hypothetical protein